MNGLIRVRAKHDDDAWEPKTKQNRAVPISAALRQHLDRYRPPKASGPGPGGGWFFPSPNGKRWDADNFSRSLRATNKEAELGWSCLDYRHTFGSQLAQIGVSLYKISVMLGNSSEVCRRHYAAIATDNISIDAEFLLPGNSLSTQGPANG